MKKILIAFWISLFVLSACDEKPSRTVTPIPAEQSTPAPAAVEETPSTQEPEPAVVAEAEPVVEPEPELDQEPFNRICIDEVVYFEFQQSVVVAVEPNGKPQRCFTSTFRR